MGNVYEAFSFNDATLTGKVIGDLTIDYCKKLSDGSAVSQTGMTLMELGVGDYQLMNPNITERTICRLHVTADSTKRAVVMFDPIDGNIAVDATVAKDSTVAKDATVSKPGTAQTITPIDSSGITTLLSRIAGALTITGGKVDVNDKTGFSGTATNMVPDVSADVTAIKAKTDNLPPDPADESLLVAAADAIMNRIGEGGVGLTALGDTRIAHLDADVSSRNATTPPTVSDIADAVHDEVIEGALTSRQIQRIMLAPLAGKSTGAGTATVSFRDTADAKDRITATVDDNGNRTAVTLDGA